MFHLIQAGALFAILTFVHFFADWIFQTNHEAINKHKNFYIRARHCFIYTISFIPIFLIMKLSFEVLLYSTIVLFVSHFIIDTYIPVFLWAKYIRKIPDLQSRQSMNREEYFLRDSKKIFAELWTHPVYPILFITIDQILHLTFLWPITYFIIFI